MYISKSKRDQIIAAVFDDPRYKAQA